ncbi:MAG: T9SS type A sorting domain-containing protein [Saprospiraceae bacterium]
MKKKILILLVNIIYGLSLNAQNSVDSMTFYKDYFPGKNDINGRFLGSTETMAIVQHKGKLFAGMGNWMDYPVTPQHEGTQVLRKDAYNSPWVVDTSVGYTSLRSDAIASVFFSKDVNNQTLNPKVNLLVGGFSDILNPKIAGIWVRNDNSNLWYKNNVFQLPSEAGIRSFAVHSDKVTGKQFLFGGLTAGSIVKAQYDESAEGLLVVDPKQELSGQGRVMAMCECNGDLYAAAGVDVIGKDTLGGLYRRIDGTNPSWQLVYRWPYTSVASGDEKNIMRGITCVPDPLGSKNEVIIGTRANPGIVQVIQPFNNHKVYTEFDIRGFFAKEWWGGTYNGPTLSAYNNFYPDTQNGNKIWWMSLWVENPNYRSHPYNGSYFMQRSLNGTYKYGHIYDNANPLPTNKRLRACRTICKSPFAEDQNAVYYFGGYDCAQDTSNNTSWIYKGVLAKKPTSVSDVDFNLSHIIYPNPVLTTLYIGSNYSNVKQYQIINSLGQVLQISSIKDNSIDVSFLQKGIYYIQLKDDCGGFKVSKFIKE